MQASAYFFMTYHSVETDAVIAIGGGNVIDLGKALAAMLPHGNSILPFLAIPTTCGTGGEVSKSAVISEVGPQGYKKSPRHDNFLPSAVILDGSLLTLPIGH